MTEEHRLGRRAATAEPTADVVVLGGGLAGLTCALQILRARPHTEVVIVERAHFPLPEAAHKVGESTVEASAHYFETVLGLRDHLKSAQLRKEGLRFFGPHEGNEDIVPRLEVGFSHALPTWTYQLDRGRFENELADRVRAAGATLLQGTHVEDVELGDEEHRVVLRDSPHTGVRGRWLVDATGRRGLLKQKLGLRETVDHDVNAVWFRIGRRIDLEHFPDADPARTDAEARKTWLARVEGNRWQSTNHLMGPGYWTWLIPLASGSTSVGIVADARMVPFRTINRFERALAWLHEHEPQVARDVAGSRDLLQDFHVLRHFAHGCTRVFSADRWCLTGEAGVFLDPLYSPGSDFIASANSYITDLVVRELDGEDVGRRADSYDQAYLASFEGALPTWRQQYALMGNAQVFAAKVVWDTLAYFGVNSLLFTSGAALDLPFMESLGEPWQRHRRVAHRIQGFLREWAEVDEGVVDAMSFVDLSAPLYHRLNVEILAADAPDALRDRFHEHFRALERVAVELMRGAALRQGVALRAQDIDPLTFDLGAELRKVPQDVRGERRTTRLVGVELAEEWHGDAPRARARPPAPCAGTDNNVIDGP
ncbi:NAD(P)/FAD-dependent oxidoreductase [Streptomyces diacarni]|uniref:NAD(P)/FAD-dependent oxidoreductase n=1 Tax=Streptomyces diacarni TaxID=2800381 RepID=UPI0015EFE979|nr:NAD(P)/FAD-dependent oxidoreductase [Streptomyces diacarni]